MACSAGGLRYTKARQQELMPANSVVPAKAGTQGHATDFPAGLDARRRGHDGRGVPLNENWYNVHFNPAKHALALTAAAWPYSTLLRSVARGLYPSDRAGDGSEIAETGERPDE